MGSSCTKVETETKVDNETGNTAAEKKEEPVTAFQQLIKKLENLKKSIEEKKIHYSNKTQKVIEESKVEFEKMKEQPFLKDVYLARLKMLKRRKDNLEKYHKMLLNVESNLSSTIDMISRFENNEITKEFVKENREHFRNINKATELIDELRDITAQEEEVVFDHDMTEEDEENFKKFIQEVDPSVNTSDMNFALPQDILDMLPQTSEPPPPQSAESKVEEPPPPQTVETKVAEAEVEY